MQRADARGARLVFVDGVFAPDRSDALDAAGVEIQTLGAALCTDIHWARDLLGVRLGAGDVELPHPEDPEADDDGDDDGQERQPFGSYRGSPHARQASSSPSPALWPSDAPNRQRIEARTPQDGRPRTSEDRAVSP